MPTADETRMMQLVKAHLPAGAELASIERPAPHPAVYAADLDGDRVPEIAAVYRLNGELHLLVLRHGLHGWGSAADIKGPGYQVHVLTAAPVAAAGRNNLIVGWQLGVTGAKLSIYEWTREGMWDIAAGDTIFTYIEVMDIPSFVHFDGIAELALWIHDTGEAYRVEVVRWQDGKFVPAPDVYPFYYPKVVAYYTAMTCRYPDYGFYWYYLADAQLKAGAPYEALESVRKALSLESSAPYREQLLALEKRIKEVLGPAQAFRAPALYPASVNTAEGLRWGYIDSTGRMAIPPHYDYANDFQENGLAVVEERGKAGLIDTAGHFVVKPVYDSIGPFSEGRSAVIDKQGFKLMDQTGRIVTKKAYPFIAAMKEGRAMFYVGEPGGTFRYGYLDAQGSEVIPAQYEEAGDFANGKAVVKVREGEYALIGLDGRRLASYPYAFVGTPGDGLLPFQQQSGGKYGYIDERGRIAIAPAYSSAMSFEEGRAVVNTAEDFGAKYGLIDKKGSFVVKPEYSEILQLGEQRIALGRAIAPDRPYIGARFAIADNNGKRLTDFVYLDVSDFKNGLASATDGNETYLIGRNGKPARGYPRISGRGILKVLNGLIQANVDQRLSYLDRSGRVVWQRNTVIPLRPPYSVKEVKYKPNKDYLVYYPQVEGIDDQGTQRGVNAKLAELSGVKPVPAEAQLDYSYTGDFEVLFFRKDLLELRLEGYNYPFGAAHGMPSRTDVHLNLRNGRMYQLQDLFKPGSDYVPALSEIVGRQIREDPQYSYVFTDQYKGIKPDQPFYVTEDALHLYFQPYDIAPYAAGFPTFTIPFREIMNLIDTNGEFWKSFHP